MWESFNKRCRSWNNRKREPVSEARPTTTIPSAENATLGCFTCHSRAVWEDVTESKYFRTTTATSFHWWWWHRKEFHDIFFLLSFRFEFKVAHRAVYSFFIAIKSRSCAEHDDGDTAVGEWGKISIKKCANVASALPLVLGEIGHF